MRSEDRLSGAFWLILSLVGIEGSYRLGLGTLHNPGPGFFPLVTSSFLGVLSILLLLSTIGRKPKITEKEGIQIFNRQGFTKVLYVIGALFAYAMVLDILGFVLCTLILIGFLLKVVERQKWWVTITCAVSVPLACHVLFNVLLQVQLPRGFLGF